MTALFGTRLANKYGDLSNALRQAADYLSEHPIDIATRPLRAVSKESGVSPAAFTRLAHALDYEGFEELREEMRAQIGRRMDKFADRAERLQQDHALTRTGFFDAHLLACQQNLETLSQTIDRELLDQATDRIAKSRQVLLLGALASTGIVEYFSYLANFHAENWSLAGRMGASLGGSLTSLSEEDALIIITKPPFAARAIRAAELARNKGAYVVVITDTHSCPALQNASAGFIVPTDSPHFFSSYVVTLFLVETLIGMLVSRSGDPARKRISEVENTSRVLAEVWDQ